MDKQEITTIVDQLIRLGLVKEEQPEGSDVPLYSVVERDKSKVEKAIEKFNEED